MRGVSEFAKLVNAGGALVEFDERRVNGGQIERGVRAAETAKARVSRGRWVNREQMENAAAECVDDVRQLFCEVAQCARLRHDGEIFFVEWFELGFQFFAGSRGKIFCRAEEPRERAVNCVCGPREIWMDGNSDIRTVRPMLPVFFVEQVGFCLEITGFGERQFDLPAIGSFLHRQVAPRCSGGRRAAGVRGNDFAP